MHRSAPFTRLSVWFLAALALVTVSCGSADLAVDVETGAGDPVVTLAPTDDPSGVDPAADSTTTPTTTNPATDPPVSTSGVDTTSTTPTTASTTTAPAAAPVVYAMSELTASEPPTSYRMRMSAEFGGFPEFGAGDSVAFSIAAAFSEDGRYGEMEVDMSELIAADPAGAGDLVPFLGDVLAMKFIGDTVYVSAGMLSWIAPVDTPWIGMVDDASMSGVSPSIGAVDSGEVLGVLRSLDADAEEVGREEMDGVEVVHIRGTVSAESLAATGNESFLSEMDPTGAGLLRADVFDIDVWVGTDGIVRRLEFGVEDLAGVDPTAPAGAFFRIVLEISDVGRPVTIEAPPASEVTWFDDIAPEWFTD